MGGQREERIILIGETWNGIIQWGYIAHRMWTTLCRGDSSMTNESKKKQFFLIVSYIEGIQRG